LRFKKAAADYCSVGRRLLSSDTKRVSLWCLVNTMGALRRAIGSYTMLYKDMTTGVVSLRIV
jgi:hypothetical protein